MRILEIGAGTGGMTETALQALTLPGGIRLFSTYTFTDISPGFFQAARERFSGYEGINYQVLDISRDPIEQDFDAEQYDLVIAANVRRTPYIVPLYIYYRGLHKVTCSKIVC